MIDYAYFQEPIASQLAQMRIEARQKRSLTYDCMNAIVVGDAVVCKKRHKFPGIGNRKQKGISLLSTLKGRSSGICLDCKDYDGETSE